MTFLWKKKSRVAGISQRFMSELHSPSKNSGSMVVVKNKNRLRKLSSKRTQDDDDDDQDWEISDPVLTFPLPLHLVCPEACADLVELESRGSGYSGGEIEEVEPVRESEIVSVAKTSDDHVVSGKGKHAVFVNVLKAVVVVVVLGLSTRRSTAAVVMLVVLVLLLELIGKRLIGSSSPCSDARAHIQCIAKTFVEMEDVVISEEETTAERNVDRDDCSLFNEIGEIKQTVLIHDDDELVAAADISSVGGAFLDSGRYEPKAHKHDRDVKYKFRFMKMTVPKKLKNPKIGGVGVVQFEAEQLQKENRWKVEGGESVG